jgi:hypothetical protein
MTIRNLKTGNTGHNEFNHLRISNLDEFLLAYKNNLDFYETPFKIIANLEEEIKFENNPKQTILIAYKDEGDVIFQLDSIEIQGALRVVTYSYDTFIS